MGNTLVFSNLKRRCEEKLVRGAPSECLPRAPTDSRIGTDCTMNLTCNSQLVRSWKGISEDVTNNTQHTMP